MRVRDATPDDAAWVVALNAASEPHVGPMDRAHYLALASMAAAVRVAEADETPLGVAILFAPGAAYGSENYRWFEENAPRSLYVDRVMVAAAARCRGVGKALYEDALALGEVLELEGVSAEVNDAPPNPVSMAFHASFGFETLTVRPLSDGNKRVAMLYRPLVLETV
ncbi:MAG: GNAT family N-acetyltransferase [Pseudomonadota bacterium]